MCKLVLYYRKTCRHAINSLAGALQTDEQTRQIPIVFPKNYQELLRVIDQSRDEQLVVGWSFYSPEFAHVRDELRQLRQDTRSRQVLYIAGGVHSTAEPLQTLQAGFDYVAIGEGEQILVDLMRARKNRLLLKQVRGLAYLENDQLLRNGKGEHITLDDYPPFCDRYRKFGAMEITRGCIYACKFCQTPFINKARFRHRSLENITHNTTIMHRNGLRDYRFITPSSRPMVRMMKV